MDFQESLGQIKKTDIPISLNEYPLKNVWHFVKESGELISKLFKHKVCSVSETRTPGAISWKGLLDNDEYFLIIVMDGVLMGSCGEREMMIPFDLHTLAYVEDVCNIISMSDEIAKFTELLRLKENILPKIMVNLKFEEIMEIFMWEYISPSVEVYNTNIL